MKKRILSALLAALMLLTMVPAAFAAGGDPAEVTVEPYVVAGQTTIEEQYFQVDTSTTYRFGVKLTSDSFTNGQVLAFTDASVSTKKLDGDVVDEGGIGTSGSVEVKNQTLSIPAGLGVQFELTGVLPYEENSTYEVNVSLTVDGKAYSYTYYVGINCEPSNKPKYVAQVGDVKYPSLQEAVDAAKDGETVTLIDDSPAGVDIRKKITLDLNGHTITQSSTWTVGIFSDVTIRDSSNGQGQIVNASEDTSAVNVHAAVLVKEEDLTGRTCKLTIEGGVITSTKSKNSYGIFSNTAKYAPFEKYGPTILVRGGTIEGGKNGLSVTHDSDLVISGGTIIGGDFAVAGNGNRHNTKITISGGLLKQTSALGSALFHPQIGELTITSGTLEGDNTGIEMRSGTLNISGGEIIGGMGTPSSQANGSGTTTFNSAVAVAQHTTTNPIMVNITGGTLTGGAAFYESDPNSIYADSAVQKPVVSVSGGDFSGQVYSADCQNFVSGGFFTENPDKYAAADKTAVASGRADYPWTIADATDSIVKPAVGEPSVNMDAIDAGDRDAVEAAAKEIDVQGLAAYASTEAQKSKVDEASAEQALKDAGIAGAETSETHVYAQAYLQIVPTGYTKPVVDGGESVVPKLTLDITPMYRLVASTASNPADIKVQNDTGVTVANAVIIPNTKPEKLDVKGTVHMVVPMPDGFVSQDGTIFVQHKNYEYAAALIGISDGSSTKYIAKFDNPHGFSTFTFTMSPTSEAGLNGIGYAKLADAIADAKDNEIIFVMKDGLTASMSGDSRTIKLQNSDTQKAITVTINGETVEIPKGETVDYTYTRPSTGGGSSGSSNRTLTFNVNGGSAIKNLTKAKGTTIDLSDYVPTRTGYTFAGWYTDKELTEKITSVKLNENTTVYAKWTKNADESIAGFTDVKAGDWFAEEVQYVVDKGLMNGVTKTTFAPSATTTRGMIVTILYRLEGSPKLDNENLGYPYADVNASAYYGDAVYWARLNGIVNGYSAEKFGPNDAITREQMAAILYRYAQYKGYDVSKTAKLDDYKDGAEVSAYATAAMQWANGEGLITGKTATTLVPKGDATRAEVATILMRFCENVAK
ncbi:MAG: S-layer homology domain-containing protein [Agathobaculum sp.]|jgi:uncharacterized repeat protein (TIGR02543 family)|uniref:S-layer homology domain-containing protein n=1 Tax=Agathobaculum sp. TaxID=2048138 RepID=UPI003D914DCD